MALCLCLKPEEREGTLYFSKQEQPVFFYSTSVLRVIFVGTVNINCYIFKALKL